MSSTIGGGLRALRLNPGFAAVAVASLALGIGVNTAIFSLVDQLLLWSAPARDPERLVSVRGGRSDAYPFFREYRERNQVFSGMLASSRPLTAGLRPEGAPAVEVGQVHYVSGEYFQTLGIGAAAGRVIAPADDVKPGGSPVAVLSHGYWRRRFAGDAGVIGKKLAVNGYPLEIAGIAEKGFEGLYNGHAADVFAPLTMYPVTTPSAARAWNTPNMFWLVTMARLKPGIPVQQAQAAMQVLWPQVAEAVNDSVVKAGGKPRTYKQEQITLTRGTGTASTYMLDPLRTLAAATGLVLLIACANVANLLLARAAGRRREIAVRLAMGATRARLVRQLLGESLVLAAIGGSAGIAVAWMGVSALGRAEVLGPAIRFRPSLVVLAASAGVTLATGILFGLAPAFRATGLRLSETLKEGGAAGQSGSRMRLGKALVGVQVALSLALVAGAGLFIRTLRNLQNVDLGFERDNVLVVDVDPGGLGYRGHRLRTFYDQLLERTRRTPGVRAATLSGMTPMGMYAMSRSFSAEGYQPQPNERLVAYSNPVASGFFTTLGIPMLLGRDFRAEDEPAVTPGESLLASFGRSSGSSGEAPANASRVCIIDEMLARHLFGGASPVGRHLSHMDRYTAEKALEIVGVVKDAHYGSIKERNRIGMIYVPSWSDGASVRWLVVRTAGDPGRVLGAIRRELVEMDPNVPVLRSRTIEEHVNDAMQRERLIAFLSGFFGLLAPVLAAVGLYGVLAYSVTRRTREIGIRMALGARRGDVVRMVVGESLAPVAAGMLAGMAGALALARFLAGLLYGVAPRDPVSLALAAAAMLAVALAAAAIPARRASRVEPMTALRYE